MVKLSLETSSLIVFPVNARSGTSAEHLNFFLGTRLECLCVQPWLPFEEDRAVRSDHCGLSDHCEDLAVRVRRSVFPGHSQRRVGEDLECEIGRYVGQ